MVQEIIKSELGSKEVQGVFFNSLRIPADWEHLKFSDVVLVNPPTKVSSNVVAYVPMDAVNINKGSIDYFEERNFERVGSLPKFQENDVLFARITPSTENGKVCIVKKFNNTGIASSELIVLRPTIRVIPDYLYFFVKTSRIRQYAISQMKGTTGRQRVPESVFKSDLYFELPSIKEQKRIAEILVRIHNQIQKTDQIIEQTQKLKKGLMQKLLTKGIGHRKYKELTLFPLYLSMMIPEDWTIAKFGGVTKRITYGFTNPMPHAKEGPWLITAKDVKHGQINYETAEKTTPQAFKQLLSDKSRPKLGTVLITKDGTLGEVAIVDRKDICINQSVATLESSEAISSEFLALCLQSPITKRIIEVYSPSTTIRHISITDLAEWKFGLPSLEEQKKIIAVLSNVDSYVENSYRSRSNLQIIKQGLIQNLLTGKIRVKV